MRDPLELAQEEARTDTTAMIDCVFLLIVFFLCMDFRSLEAKLPAHLPRDRGARPSPAEPVQQLPVRIECVHRGRAEPRRPGTGPGAPHRLVDHAIRWRIGPRTVTDPTVLAAELGTLAADRSLWVVDPAADRLGPMTVVVEPGPGTVYDDVARTVDACRAAGFQRVLMGSAP